MPGPVSKTPCYVRRVGGIDARVPLTHGQDLDDKPEELRNPQPDCGAVNLLGKQR